MANAKNGNEYARLDATYARKASAIKIGEKVIRFGKGKAAQITAAAKLQLSLENAMKLYANQIEPGATGVVVHTYKDGEAYEIEVLCKDGNTVSVDTVADTELSEFVRKCGKALRPPPREDL